MGYDRLTPEERYQIEALLISGIGVRGIARRLNRNPGTISREIERNRPHPGHHYKAKIAINKSVRRRLHVGPKPKLNGQLLGRVVQRLKGDWSPEQISEKLLDEGIRVSHETIYKRVYEDFKNKGELWMHLRRRRRWRRTRRASRALKNIGKRTNRAWIADRPRVVEERRRLGDLERDTMEGKRGGSVLLTLVDRTSRLTRIRWIKKKSAMLTHQETVKALRSEKVRTITNDNGPEFELHHATAKALKAKIYFTRPYCSWERGTNENTNGLIRQYFPKNEEPNKAKIKKVERLLNTRPRKCLGFKTPLEVHRKLSRVLR